MKRIFLFLFTASLVSSARAEYRAYQYAVVDKTSSNQEIQNIVITSLDPVSYIAYHGGSNLVNVDLLRTWVCPGHTGKKEICPSPYSKLPKEFYE